MCDSISRKPSGRRKIIAASGALPTTTGFSHNVKFVVNLAHQLFQNILQGHALRGWCPNSSTTMAIQPLLVQVVSASISLTGLLSGTMAILRAACCGRSNSAQGPAFLGAALAVQQNPHDVLDVNVAQQRALPNLQRPGSRERCVVTNTRITPSSAASADIECTSGRGPPSPAPASGPARSRARMNFSPLRRRRCPVQRAAAGSGSCNSSAECTCVLLRRLPENPRHGKHPAAGAVEQA